MLKSSDTKLLPQTSTPAYPARLATATEARQNFPDLLQVAYGEKSLCGICRFSRLLAAIVPPEAVRILMGDSTVDEETRIRIRNAARNLLESQKGC